MRNDVRAVVLSILLLGAVGLFDYATTPLVVLGILYHVPIAFTAWKANRATGLVMAGLATAMWLGVDLASGIQYPSSWFLLWNAAARAASFVLIVLLVSALCEQQKRLRDTMEASERAAQRITQLQSELQLICSWTNRIRSEGQWMRFEEFMQRNFQIRFTHGMSDEAAQNMHAEIERTLKDTREHTQPE